MTIAVERRADPRAHARPAFALIEVLVSLAIVAALLTVFALSAADSRRAASLGDSINNLKQYAWAGSAYTGDCAERVWTFSWRAGTSQPSEYGDLQFAPTDLDAAACQAADIIRRRHNGNFPRISAWVPHIMTSHLVLADQFNLPLPLPWVASPADVNRLAWQRWPNNPVPLPLGPPENVRWVYSSSYEFGPAFWSRDQRQGSQNTVEQSSTHNTYIILSGVILGDRSLTQVVYPSRKAMVWESHQRFFGPRTAFYAYPEARVPVLTVDGSVVARASSEANDGFSPNNPTSPFPTRFTYSPLNYESPALPGVSAVVAGKMRWTRGGLTGRDFGAPEVCTGQGGCTP